MHELDITILRRDVIGLLIPSGAEIHLQQGSEVVITQSLGTSYTVNVYGNLVRIDGKDGDALGKDQLVEEELPADATVDEKLMTKLKSCYDPEIPVNIVDLGLIYACESYPLGHHEFRVVVKMTLTAPGCGMGPVIMEEVKQKALSIKEVTEAEVELVFDPPWTQDMMSDTAKLELGMF